MKIQIDITKELHKKLRMYKEEYDYNSLAVAVEQILKERLN